MPIFIEEITRHGKKRRKFIEEMERKAPKRKPKRVGVKPAYGTLFALRNKRLTIREGALRLVQIIITYTKITDHSTHRYTVCPYSYRYRRMADKSRKKLLFAWDVDDKHIKGFVLANIRKVALTDRKFRPRWKVEIA